MKQVLCRLGIVLAFVLAAGCSDDGSPQTSPSALRCTEGALTTCACAEGRVGTQTCKADGTYGVCACAPEGPTCTSGSFLLCTCSSGGTGRRACGANGQFGACTCDQDAGSATCVPGLSIACACPTGAIGAQVCSSGGTFGACSCVSADAGAVEPPPPVDTAPPAPDAPVDTGPPPPITVETVLEFPEPNTTTAVHVFHGKFWEENSELGFKFFWDAYVAPKTTGYLVSDGYGGAHTMLWGPAVQLEGELIFQGNIWNGKGAVPFGAAEGPAPGEWGYHAVTMGWDQFTDRHYIITYWNGIATGVAHFGKETRKGGLIANGQLGLYVMGSNHQNLGGRLAAIRAWDKTSPIASFNNMTWAFVPERSFSTSARYVPVDFLVDYTRPAIVIEDLAPLGYNGGGTGLPARHPGRIENTPISLTSPNQGFSVNAPSFGPLAHWVVDKTSPYGKPIQGDSEANPGEKVPTPVTPPAKALVFDSFSRPSQTFLRHRTPSLGMTEGGSLGPRPWQTGIIGTRLTPAVFGLLNGRAAFLEHQAGMAWVDVGTGDQDIKIRRMLASSQVGTTGIAFRVKDNRNWWYAYVMGSLPVLDGQGTREPDKMQLGRFVNGTAKEWGYHMPTRDWKFLRVVASGSTVKVYIDYQENVWVEVAKLENVTDLQTATGAGLAGANNPPAASSLWRADDFTVCAVGQCPLALP